VQIQTWIILCFIVGGVSWWYHRGSVDLWPDIPRFLIRCVEYDLLVVLLLGLVVFELSKWKEDPVSPEAMLLLGLLLTVGHFLPRMLVVGNLSLEEPESEQENPRNKLREGLFEFAEGQVREVMVPLGDVFKVGVDQTLAEVISQEDYKPYSRIPVYDTEKDNIVGVLYSKDVIEGSIKDDVFDPTAINVTDYIKEPFLVPELMDQTELLKEFQKRKIHMAIVVDEYGTITGIVTLEDLLETIVGEVQDQRNDNEDFVQETGFREWVLDAKFDLDDLEELVKVEVDCDAAETLGGYVFHKLGQLPREGDSTSYRNLEFTVLAMERYRIRKIGVKETS